MPPKAARRFLPAILALAMACRPCPPSDVVESKSPDGAYVAISYRRECGGAASSFDVRVAIRSGAAQPEDADTCLPETSLRRWTTRLPSSWRDIRVEYALGPKLTRLGGNDLLKRLTQ